MNIPMPLAALVAALLLAGPTAAQQKVTISIATVPTGGVYYPLGGGIANVLSKYVPGYAANAESTAGSVANLQLMTQRLLEAYGIDWIKDLRRERLTPEKSADAIKYFAEKGVQLN